MNLSIIKRLMDIIVMILSISLLYLDVHSWLIPIGLILLVYIYIIDKEEESHYTVKKIYNVKAKKEIPFIVDKRTGKVIRKA